MRIAKLALATATFGWLLAPAFAEEAPPADAGAPTEAAAPAQTPAEAPTETASEAKPAPHAKHVVAIGPVAHDGQGREGRLHTVVHGDTLWDISDAYLGTPWVWPAVWRDNGDIKNPHRIYPGDKIWISPHEMRRVSEEEAAAMLSQLPMADMPASLQDADAMGEYDRKQTTYHLPSTETTGFISEEELEGSAAIVDSPADNAMLDMSTPVIIGLGKGMVGVGDQFEVFRTSARLVDPETREPIGYATEQLGWLEVTAVHDETATAVIRHQVDPIERGDHVRPRDPRPTDIAVLARPDVQGEVIYANHGPLNMVREDVVFLNRGSSEGLAVGSPLEVYEPLGTGFDEVRKQDLALPDRVVAKLLVVDVHPQNAVAIVTHSEREFSEGARFRGAESLAP